MYREKRPKTRGLVTILNIYALHNTQNKENRSGIFWQKKGRKKKEKQSVKQDQRLIKNYTIALT